MSIILHFTAHIARLATFYRVVCRCVRAGASLEQFRKFLLELVRWIVPPTPRAMESAPLVYLVGVARETCVEPALASRVVRIARRRS